VNLYAYAYDSPINDRDSLGLRTDEELGNRADRGGDTTLNAGDIYNTIHQVQLLFPGVAAWENAWGQYQQGNYANALGYAGLSAADIALSALPFGYGAQASVVCSVQRTGSMVGQQRGSRIIGLRNPLGKQFYTDEDGFFFAIDRSGHKFHIGPWRPF
jgi:hypothetical protein